MPVPLQCACTLIFCVAMHTLATVLVHFYNNNRTVPTSSSVVPLLSRYRRPFCYQFRTSRRVTQLEEPLRLKPSLLSQIQKDCSDEKDCLVKLLTEWLNKTYNTARFGDPSWQLLVAAVAHPAGGNNPALAQLIATKYNGECVMLQCVYRFFAFIHMSNKGRGFNLALWH